MGACCQKQEKSVPLLLDEFGDGEDPLYPHEAEVLYEYVGVDENQLTIKKGETIIIIDASEELNGWALAANNNNDEGYVPKEYIKRIQNKEWRKSEKFRKAQKLMEKYKADKEKNNLIINNNGNQETTINPNEEQQKQPQQDEAKLLDLQDPNTTTESVKKSDDLKD